jgi:hypothetical protein
MTIIVGGYIVGYPLGGMSWHHLNYLLGLQELGHEVWFYEYGAWPPYNPVTRTAEWDHSYGTEYLGAQFRQYGLPANWCYQMGEQTVNMTRQELAALFARADLMICVSGITPLEVIDPRPKLMLVIDTDPVFTQLRMSRDLQFLSYYKKFDACATFGRLIGTSVCELPTHGINWIPTNQPIALSHWPVIPCTSNAFTTIGRWEHAADRHIEFQGRTYLSSKSVEWQKVIDLPGHTNWTMTLAMQAMPHEAADRFRAYGWNIVDPEVVAHDCKSFQNFLAESAGEFTVAKQIYSQIKSGWYSDRSAAYLASGRPVVTQSTGFESWIPTGQGLFAFETLGQAQAALDLIESDYSRHQKSARELAEQYFGSQIVLRKLLGEIA